MSKTINYDDGRMDSLVGNNKTFFTGTDDMINLSFTPIVTGYAFIFWVRLPEWFKEDEDLKYFEAMTQKNFQSFQGLTDMELETATHQMGFNGNEFNVATVLRKGNTDFTLRHKEYMGSPIRKLYQKWISYISDPRTGVAVYPRLFDGQYEYSARNHSAQLLYVMTRPDVYNVGKHAVEFAAFYMNVIPRTIPLSHYAYEQGNQDSPTVEINFNGVLEIGPDVEEYAGFVLDSYLNGTGDGSFKIVDMWNSDPIEEGNMLESLGAKKYSE
jgi:hypothetical protein